MKKIFISYSDEDRTRMRSLERIINKSKHFDPIIIADRRDPLKALTDKVKSGIFESDYIIPILTKKSIKTQWVNQEIGYAYALNKKVLPIVEKSIINSLKGFIHKNIDLPYNFSEQKNNAKNTRGIYRKTCELLITDLLIENNYHSDTLDLKNLFSGIWKSEYSAPHIRGSDKKIEIKEVNKYFVDDRHCFNIENFKLSSDNKVITFTKLGVGNDNRRLKNNLRILKLGEIYQGIEMEEIDRKPIEITYFKK